MEEFRTLCAAIIYGGQGADDLAATVKSVSGASRIIIANAAPKEDTLLDGGYDGAEVTDCRELRQEEGGGMPLHRGRILKKLIAQVNEDMVTFLRAGDTCAAAKLASALSSFGGEADMALPRCIDAGRELRRKRNTPLTMKLRGIMKRDGRNGAPFVVDAVKDYVCFPCMLYGGVYSAKRAKATGFSDDLMNGDAEADFLLRFLDEKKKYVYADGIKCDSIHYYENHAERMREPFRAEWYSSFIEDMLLPLMSGRGAVPKYMQCHAIYMLWSRLKANVNDNDKLVLTGGLYEKFMADIDELLSFIEPECLFARSNVIGMDKQMQIWLYMKKTGSADLGLTWREDRDDKGDKDFVLICGGADLMRLSDYHLTVSLMEWENGRIELDGNYSGFINGAGRKTAYFRGKPVEMTNTALWSGKKYFGEEYYRSETFHMSIPLKKGEAGKLRFKYEFGGNEYFFKVRFVGGASKLTGNFGGGGYWSFGSHIATMRDGNTSVEIVNRKAFSGLKHELRMWYGLMRTPGFIPRAMIGARLVYWITRPFYCKKRIWITYDKLYKGGDCGEYFYRYAKDNKDGVKVYYLLNKTADAMKAMKKEGLHPVTWHSIRHRLLFLNAEMIMATHAGVYPYNCFGPRLNPYFRGVFHGNVCCIQHGLSMQGLEPYQNRVKDNTKRYYCASKYEIDNLSAPAYDYRDKNVFRLTGIPRFDGLMDKHKKQILITPTWRHYLAMPPVMGSTRPYNPDFKDSTYFTLMNELLHDGRVLSAARKKGYTLLYLLHPTFTAQLPDFDTTGIDDVVSVVPATGVNYEQLLTESALMVTDYSGVQYDFAFQKKPIIYYHHKDIPAHYSSECFDYHTMGFGEVAENNEEMSLLLSGYIENDCAMKAEYIARVEDFFAFLDHESSERIYKDALKWANGRRYDWKKI